MSRNRLLAAFLILSSLLLMTLIFTDWLPYLRGPAPETGEWYWPHRLRPFGRWWAPLLAALALFGVAAWWLRPARARRWPTVAALAGLATGSLLLQLALIYADRPDVAAELIDRTLSNLESGFFEPAAEIDDIHALLRHYPQAMPNFVSEHARTHPPGLILANWLTIRALAALPGLSEPIANHVWPLRCIDLWLLNRPPSVAAALALWSILPLVASALTVVPAYVLARRLVALAPARLATIMVATLPALLLFAPKSVQLYAPLSLLAVLALDTGLERSAPHWFFLSGFVLSVATFLSLGNAALLLLLAVYALLFLWQQDRQQRTQHPLTPSRVHPFTRSPVHLATFTLGALSLWLIYWLGWGVPPWAIAQTGLQQHYDLVTLHRRYDWWLFYNLVDLLIYIGLPVAAGFIGALLLTMRKLYKRQLSPVAILAFALFILILVLDLSGAARGEIGRLWLFFMPLVALVAGVYLARALPGRRPALLIVSLQLAIVVSLGLAWRPVWPVIVVAERPPMPAGSAANSLDVDFGDEPITLHGYTLDASQATAGGFLDVTLYWKAAGPATRPYTVFNHLIDNNQWLAAQQDNWPVGGRWPPTCWREGETVVDSYRIELPADLTPGAYTLLTGLYDATTGQRLPTTNGQDAITLTTIIIPAHP